MKMTKRELHPELHEAIAITYAERVALTSHPEFSVFYVPHGNHMYSINDQTFVLFHDIKCRYCGENKLRYTVSNGVCKSCLIVKQTMKNDK